MMTNQWVPSNNFDDELLAMQPECDVTFANYPPTESTMATQFLKEHRYEIPDRQRDARIVDKIKEAWPSGVPIGKLVTRENNNDIEEGDTREYEIMSMIRRAGMGPSVEECLTSKRTIPAISSNKSYVKDAWPILINENHFRLKPRKSNSSIASSSNSSETSSINSALNSSVSEDDQVRAGDRLNSKIASTTTTSFATVNPNVSKEQIPRRKIGATFSSCPTEVTTTDNSKFLRANEIVTARNKLVFLTPQELYRRKRPQYNDSTINKGTKKNNSRK